MTRFQKCELGGRRVLGIGLATAILLTVGGQAVGEEFRVEVALDLTGKLNLRFASETNCYYILYQGESLTNITVPRAMLMGQNGADRFVVALQPPANPGSAFFRIGKVPINQPLDSNHDGIPDDWALHHQFDPLDPTVAASDGDRDGLTSLEEWHAGTDPHCADTDGDGLWDGFEVKESLSNPLLSDITQIVTVAEASGATATSRLGRWAVEGDAIYAQDRRGFVEYSLLVPTADVFRIEVEGRERSSLMPVVTLDLLVSVDGEHLGRVPLTYGSQTNGVAWKMTPWLTPGAHTVRVYWDNAADGRSLLIKAVRLQALAGPDSDANGIKDWVDDRLRVFTGVDMGGTPVSGVFEAATSPCCLEGWERHFSALRLNWTRDSLGTETTDTATASHGAGYRWYADIPLSPTEPTRVEASFQNGGLKATNRIVWKPTNLLTNGNLSIRLGDALLFTAAPVGAADGSVNIAVGGITNYTGDWTLTVPHQFNQPGTCTVAGTYTSEAGDSISRSITVKVVSAAFNGSPAAWVGKGRSWDCPDLPPNVVVDVDPDFHWGYGLYPTGWVFFFHVENAEPHYLVARIGRAGPILASARVDGFRIHSADETGVKVIQVYPDGSQLIEMLVVQSPVVPSIDAYLEIIVPAVTFDDGTITKALTAADFDALGQCPVRFLRQRNAGTSVCHTLRARQDGIPIGLRWP
jgi:hypothetical protein